MYALDFAYQKALDADGQLHLKGKAVGFIRNKRVMLSPWLNKTMKKSAERLCARMGYAIIGVESPIDIPLTTHQPALEPALLKPRGTRR